MQAMSVGLPTITTRHSGMLEFTTADTVMYVDVSDVEPPESVQRIYDSPTGSTWGEPSVPQLTEQLQRVVAMTPTERQALGARARDHIVAHFSIDAVGRSIAQRLVTIEKKVRQRVAAAERELAISDQVLARKINAAFDSNRNGSMLEQRSGGL